MAYDKELHAHLESIGAWAAEEAVYKAWQRATRQLPRRSVVFTEDGDLTQEAYDVLINAIRDALKGA